MHNEKAPLRLFLMVQTWYTKGWNKSLESSTWNLQNYQIAWTWWLASSQLERVCWMWGVTMLSPNRPLTRRQDRGRYCW